MTGYGVDKWLFRLYVDDDTQSASSYSIEHSWYVDSVDGAGAGARGAPTMFSTELSGWSGSTINARIQAYDNGCDDNLHLMSTSCTFIEKVA